MAKIFPEPIAPPTPELKDFSEIIRRGLENLYLDAHDHKVRSTDPASTDGSIQDMQIVDNGTDVYLIVKTRRGWFKSANFTAI